MPGQRRQSNPINSGFPAPNFPPMNTSNPLNQPNPVLGLPYQNPFAVSQEHDIPLNALQMPSFNFSDPMISQQNHINTNALFNRQASFGPDISYNEVDSMAKVPLFRANTFDFTDPKPRFTPISSFNHSKSMDTQMTDATDQNLFQNRLNQTKPGNQSKKLRIFDDHNKTSFPGKINHSANVSLQPNQTSQPKTSNSVQNGQKNVLKLTETFDSGVIRGLTDQKEESIDPSNLFMYTNQSINFSNDFI